MSIQQLESCNGVPWRVYITNVFACARFDCRVSVHSVRETFERYNLQTVALQLTGQAPFGSKKSPHHVMARSRSSGADDLQHMESVQQQHAEWVTMSRLHMLLFMAYTNLTCVFGNLACACLLARQPVSFQQTGTLRLTLRVQICRLLGHGTTHNDICAPSGSAKHPEHLHFDTVQSNATHDC